MKKLICTVLTVIMITSLLVIPGNAIQRYTKTYSTSNGTKLASVYLWTDYYDPELYPSQYINPSDHGEIKFWSTSTYTTYTYGVMAVSITGFVAYTYTLDETDYNNKKYQYDHKMFTESLYTDIDSVGSKYNDCYLTNMQPLRCRILYVMGEDSSYYSSTYNNRFTFLSQNGLPETIYFSNVSGNVINVTWEP